MQLFKRRRAEQLEAVKGFRKFNSYEKQFSMIVVLAKKIFSVIESSRVLLEASDYIPGSSPFPSDETIRDALSNILENTALFGEIVLRFPEITHTVLSSNNDWSILYKWSISFTHLNNNLLDKSTITLINLVSQELSYVEKDPNYRNPYRRNSNESNNNNVQQISVKKKKKKEVKKGPRMSSHTEL